MARADLSVKWKNLNANSVKEEALSIVETALANMESKLASVSQRPYAFAA